MSLDLTPLIALENHGPLTLRLAGEERVVGRTVASLVRVRRE